MITVVLAKTFWRVVYLGAQSNEIQQRAICSRSITYVASINAIFGGYIVMFLIIYGAMSVLMGWMFYRKYPTMDFGEKIIVCFFMGLLWPMALDLIFSEVDND